VARGQGKACRWFSWVGGQPEEASTSEVITVEEEGDGELMGRTGGVDLLRGWGTDSAARRGCPQVALQWLGCGLSLGCSGGSRTIAKSRVGWWLQEKEKSKLTSTRSMG
jgi:hypothetical protein